MFKRMKEEWNPFREEETAGSIGAEDFADTRTVEETDGGTVAGMAGHGVETSGDWT